MCQDGSAQHWAVPELLDLSKPSIATHFDLPIVQQWAIPKNATNRFLELSPTALSNDSGQYHAKHWHPIALNGIVQKQLMRYKVFQLEKASQRFCCIDEVHLPKQTNEDRNLCNFLLPLKDVVAVKCFVASGPSSLSSLESFSDRLKAWLAAWVLWISCRNYQPAVPCVRHVIFQQHVYKRIVKGDYIQGFTSYVCQPS